MLRLHVISVYICEPSSAHQREQVRKEPTKTRKQLEGNGSTSFVVTEFNRIEMFSLSLVQTCLAAKSELTEDSLKTVYPTPSEK